MEKLGLNLGYLIVQILNFAIIFITLRAWVYKPILNMLENRRKTVEKGLEDARVAADARANAEQEAARLISEAQQKASAAAREISERAEAAAAQIRSAADAEAQRIRESARAELEDERQRMLHELRGHVAALSIAAAQKLIGASLDQARQQALVDEFFSGLKAGKVTIVEEGAALQGTEVEVTSALPLEPKEQEAIKKDLNLAGAAYTFKVDPSILGGLVIKVGDRVVDGSVFSQLQSLHSSL